MSTAFHRIGTKCTSYAEDDDFEERHRHNAVIGSLRLRDAIFRARGYTIPEPPRPKAPKFRPQRRRGRGRPTGAFKPPSLNPKIVRIIIASAEHCGVPVSVVMGPERGDAKVSRARHLAMYLARRSTPASFPVIAFNLGGKDHTTVMHGVRKIEKLIAKVDVPTLNDLNAIRERLGV